MKRSCFIVKNINIGGGISRVVSYICNELSKDMDITILSIEKDLTVNKRPYKLNECIKVDYLTEHVNNYRMEMLGLAKKIRFYLKHNRFDSVIVAGMDFVPLLILSIRYLKKEGITTIAWEHANHKVGKRLGLKWIGRKMSSKLFDYIIVLTDRDKLFYQTKEKLKCQIKRIYDPYNSEISQEKYDINSKKIISCGMLIYQKGFDYAIQVAEIVLKRHPDWIWEVWGEGTERERLQKMMVEHHLENQFFLRGYSDNMFQKYSEYAFFVLSSRFEGFGMVILEALANNLPVVAFDCDAGPAEIIDNNNGYLVDCFNIEEMSSTIERLIEDDVKRKNLSAQAKCTLDRFSINLIVEQWREIL